MFSCCFFFKQKTAYDMRISDWSSDVCSSDLGYRILGTSPAAIDLAEERELFSRLLDEAGLVAPRSGTAVDVDGAVAVAEEVGYPVLVRPSFVLGGRGMEIVYDTPSLRDYLVRVADPERKSVVEGTGVPVRVDPGGRGIL